MCGITRTILTTQDLTALLESGVMESPLVGAVPTRKFHQLTNNNYNTKT